MNSLLNTEQKSLTRSYSYYQLLKPLLDQQKWEEFAQQLAELQKSASTPKEQNSLALWEGGFLLHQHQKNHQALEKLLSVQSSLLFDEERFLLYDFLIQAWQFNGAPQKAWSLAFEASQETERRLSLEPEKSRTLSRMKLKYELQKLLLSIELNRQIPEEKAIRELYESVLNQRLQYTLDAKEIDQLLLDCIIIPTHLFRSDQLALGLLVWEVEQKFLLITLNSPSQPEAWQKAFDRLQNTYEEILTTITPLHRMKKKPHLVRLLGLLEKINGVVDDIEPSQEMEQSHLLHSWQAQMENRIKNELFQVALPPAEKKKKPLEVIPNDPPPPD